MSTKLSAGEPRIIHRHCGGYLALSTSSQAPKIGVTANTEEEAKEKLNATLDRWYEILDASLSRDPALQVFDQPPPPL
jgi:hypothetical protein